jgi:hypothetical protein
MCQFFRICSNILEEQKCEVLKYHEEYTRHYFLSLYWGQYKTMYIIFH